MLNACFLHPFALFGPPTDCIMPAHTGKGRSSSLTLLIQVLIFSINTLTDTPRNNVLPVIWTLLGPIKLTDKIAIVHTYVFKTNIICSHEYSCISKSHVLLFSYLLNFKTTHYLTLINLFSIGNIYHSGKWKSVTCQVVDKDENPLKYGSKYENWKYYPCTT